MAKLIDIHELAKILCIKQSTLRKYWREYPHVFITKGTTARAARFNPDHVLEYLFIKDYTQVHKDAIYRQKYQKMGGGISGRGQALHRAEKKKKRIPDQRSSQRVGGGEEGGIPEPSGSKCIDEFEAMCF